MNVHYKDRQIERQIDKQIERYIDEQIEISSIMKLHYLQIDRKIDRKKDR